jgi:hypothetical protein
VHEDRVDKDQQFNGFRQVWSERYDGRFHGPYTVYWESGPIICMQGQYVDGRQEGIWTSWDRDGTVNQQGRYVNDEAVEVRSAPPWFTEVSDQPPRGHNQGT